MPKINARRSATCVFARLRRARLGVVRLHRHRRHDDRFFGLRLLRIGSGSERFGSRFGLRHRARLRALPRRGENALRIDRLRLGGAPLPSSQALPWLRQPPASRRAFLSACGRRCAALLLAAGHRHHLGHARLAPPPAGFFAAGAAGFAAAAVQPPAPILRRQLPLSALPQRRLAHRPCARRPESRPPSFSLSAIVSPLCRDQLTHPCEQSRREKRGTLQRARAIANCGSRRARLVSGNPLRCNRL